MTLRMVRSRGGHSRNTGRGYQIGVAGGPESEVPYALPTRRLYGRNSSVSMASSDTDEDLRQSPSVVRKSDGEEPGSHDEATSHESYTRLVSTC